MIHRALHWGWLLVLATALPLASGCGGSSTTGLGSEGDDATTGDDGSAGEVGFDLDGGLGDANGACTPRTCAAQNIGCGPAGDGCGGLLDCGSCKAPQTCGGGGASAQCGGNSGCVPKTCTDLGANCGPAGDGCGGQIDCGTCAAGTFCGGGGPSKCGAATAADGGMICTPKTCAQQGVSCGPAGDGCGGLLDCGICAAGQTCGGGGTPSQCGAPATPDAASACVPKTCASQGITCGPAGDGCGGLLSCGTCTAPQTCGGGGVAGQCGGTAACVPKTCASQGITCGPAGDGCGGLLNCGTCSMPQVCGGGGVSGQCGGTSMCVPKTCASQGFNCGPAGDGCGGLLNCGTCTAAGQYCGGGGPGVCGYGSASAGDAGTFVTCSGGAVTTISGTVVAGTDPARFGPADPLYNAYVYVPSGALQPITTGATCDQCATPQGALVSAITGIDGKFVLTNPPVGTNVPIVIQLGKWRRQINVNVTACQDNPLPTSTTRLPRNQSEGNIPRFAVDTGNVDVLECVLRKMGIDDAEFTDPNLAGGVPTSAGRVHFYQANPTTNGAGGAIIDGNTPTEDPLITSQTTLNSYDIVLFPCEGGRDPETSANQANIINYANAGGRIFATHYSYVWLYNDAPFSSTAQWKVDQGMYGGVTGYIDQTFPKGAALAQWLQLVGASTTLGQIPVQVVRHDFNSVVAPSQRWMYSQSPDPAMPLHYTFNTPVGAPASSQCGRVVFSDFHVEDFGGSNGLAFPSECQPDAPMTPQEKLLEFMLFDLSSCIQQDKPTCTPTTCNAQHLNCGPAGDGCGGLLQCGTCNAPATCGGGGVSGQCGTTSCTPKTCTQQGISCGPAGDGCGGLLNCGTCTAPLTCGGGGTPGVCGAPACTPKTCAQQGISCGPAGDGCGGLLNCGNCIAPMTCGGGGTPGVCGAPDAGTSTCTPRTCAQQGISCGPAGDGCGGLLNCGTCVAPQTCGGGGTPGVCGAPACTPITCASQNVACGPAGDGCGGLLNCGTCVAPQTCGGGGVPGQCGAPTCTPKTCAQLGIACGPAGDGCGGLLQCGTCVAPQTCGGGGVPGQCGSGAPPM